MWFVSMAKKDTLSFQRQTDREFFSVPVQVIPLFCDLQNRMTHVWSPLQGGSVVYPVSKENLKCDHQLMNRQRDAARLVPVEMLSTYPEVE